MTREYVMIMQDSGLYTFVSDAFEAVMSALDGSAKSRDLSRQENDFWRGGVIGDTQ